MADAKAARPMPPFQRPRSPHLSIFRPYINMVMSILHRITGATNYFGSLLLAAWLISAAGGDAGFDTVSRVLGSIPGLLILFGFTWSVMHHLLGGLRHMVWDSGHGYEVASIRLLSWGTLFGSVTLTGVIWVIAMWNWSQR